MSDYEIVSDDLTESTEDVVRAHVFSVSNISKQIVQDPFDSMYDTGNVIKPPHDMNVWVLLQEKSTRLRRSIEILVKNTVSLGWSLCHKYFDEDHADSKLNDEFNLQREPLVNLFQHPNDEYPLVELFSRVKFDEELTGNGYIEVVRNLKGQIERLYHVPAHTVRVLKPAGNIVAGYVQMIGNRKVYFKRFGLHEDMSYKTGEIGDNIPDDEKATELIHFKLYSPRSSFYGVPRYVSASPSITGRYFSSLRDMYFFENDATPRLVISVSGGRVSSETLKMIKEFLNAQSKGIKNYGRILVIQAEEKTGVINRENKTKIDITPLTVGQTEDASFLNYKNFCDEEIREAFGIAEAFYGISKNINRASSVVSKTATINQVFLPEIIRYEYIVNNTIVNDFGANRVVFKFERPRSTDFLQDAEIYHNFGLVGGVTPHDVRNFLNLPGYNGDWSKLPIQVIVALIQNGWLSLVEKDGGYQLVPSTPAESSNGKSESSTSDFVSSNYRHIFDSVDDKKE